jgi:hypothetical protein
MNNSATGDFLCEIIRPRPPLEASIRAAMLMSVPTVSDHPVRTQVAAAVIVATLACLAVASAAQRRGEWREGGAYPPVAADNIPYDGRFTFVRLSYDTAPGGYWYRGMPSWAHGYPISETNLMKIMNDISLLGAHDEAVKTLALDDPDLFNYPVAYLIEVSWWTMTDRQGALLREYLQKGGFLIVDDFKAEGDFGSPGWAPFEANIRRALPGARFFDLDVSHPIFRAFFEIASLDRFPQAYNAGPAVFRGLFEDNDPSKRLQMIVNYNTDISQFWEWSGRGVRPIDDTNEAYKLGVNYIMYGLTH